MELPSHGTDPLRLPDDYYWRGDPFRCVPSSSAYPLGHSTPSTSNGPPPVQSHLYGSFSLVPSSPQGPNPMHPLVSHCRYPDDNGSAMMSTMSNNKGIYGEDTRTRSPFAPYRDNLAQVGEVFQSADKGYNGAKYKNPLSGRDLNKIDTCGPFRCKWMDCRYPGLFVRKAVLMRHIETQHVAPRSFECPERNCERSFNRKDNMEEHWRRVH